VEHTITAEFQAPEKTKGQSYEYRKEDKFLAYCSNFASSTTVPYCV